MAQQLCAMDLQPITFVSGSRITQQIFFSDSETGADVDLSTFSAISWSLYRWASYNDVILTHNVDLSTELISRTPGGVLCGVLFSIEGSSTINIDGLFVRQITMVDALLHQQIPAQGLVNIFPSGYTN